jgi:hypothetical protein
LGGSGAGGSNGGDQPAPARSVGSVMDMLSGAPVA